MASFYQNFLKQGIDLSMLGVERSTSEATYFCTPKGASIIGWAGVDGIHYCFIRGFGEIVFAVSPENTNPDYVHPLAENFEDFLRLLLSCGDAAALEQAWMWNQEQFSAFLHDNPPTQSQRITLMEIADKLKLAPMENPWQYIETLQASFDYGKIKYTEDLYDPEISPAAERKAPEWKVFFDGNFWGHSGKEHAGKEMPIGKGFEWAGSLWQIPSIYVCRKGLVVEFCRKVEPSHIQDFMDKWNLTAENEADRIFTHEQQMEINRDNPLCFDFNSTLTLNGKELTSSHGCGITYNPCIPEGVMDTAEANRVVDHYGLDPACGWEIRRVSYLWKTRKKPEICALSISMKQQPVPVPGPCFHVEKPSDSICFILPQTGKQHTLTVQEYEQKELPECHFLHSPDMEYPRHFSAISYVVEPEIADGLLTVSDRVRSDQPRRVQHDPLNPPAMTDVDAAAINIIGGADGPTSIVISQSSGGKLRSACSALHFEPVTEAEWQMVFHEKSHCDLEVKLL